MSAEAAAEEAIARAMAHASESFVTATGPGGQNVNKVATAVQLRVNVYALRLAPPVFHRLKDLAGSRMTARGELLLVARNTAPRSRTGPMRANGWRSCCARRTGCRRSGPRAGSTGWARPSGWRARSAAGRSRPGGGGSRLIERAGVVPGSTRDC